MEFEAFAARAGEIEATNADLDVVAQTADLFEAARDDLSIVARFVQGRVFPAWQSRTHDIGPSRCYAALARAASPGVTAETIEDRLAELGDVGEVAAGLDLCGQTGLDAFGTAETGAPAEEDGRTVRDVFEQFDAIAAASGSGSEDRKEDLLFGLFSDSTPEEARYLARLVLGEMRIGVGVGTVRDAIAEAFDVPVDAVGRALQVTNDYGLVAERARGAGESGLVELGLEVGRPVQAMLAQTGTVTDALADWETALVETKLDGARVQVHVEAPNAASDRADECAEDRAEDRAGEGEADPADRIHLFSRNMEEVTDPLPEIVAFVDEHVEGPAILDGEVVAVDENGGPLPFQEVLRRFRRKHDVAAAREEVPTELHVFDCLHAPRGVHEELEYDGVPVAVDGDFDEEAGDADGKGKEDVAAEPDRASGQSGLETWSEAAEEATEDAGSDDATPIERSRDPGDGPGVDLLDAPLSARRAYLEVVVAGDVDGGGVVEATLTDDPDGIESLERDALAAGHEGIMLKNPEAAYTPGRRGMDWRKRKPDVETLDLVVTGAEWGEGRRAELFGTYRLSARTADGFAQVGKVATGITDEELADLHERIEPHVTSEEGQTVDVEHAVVFEVGYEEIQRSQTYPSGYALRFPRFVTIRDDLDPDDVDALERVERLAKQQ